MKSGPRVALAIFCAVLLLGAAFYRGHSVESMDVRTYAQMIRGVAEHGLPYWDNGPMDRFPELVIPHAIPSRGHIWGIYSPLYAYLATPAFRLAGLRGVSSFGFALLAPLALVTFALAKRVVKCEWYALAAAIVAVISTPLLAKALEITPFVATALLCTLAAYFTVASIEDPKASRAGVLAGVCWALGSAAHVLSFPMGAAALAVLAIAPDHATGERSMAVTRARLLPALAGYVVATLPVMLLNHLRFESLNPISYGRPPWSGPVGMSIVDQARWGLPVAGLVAIVLAAMFVARGKPAVLIAIAVAAVVIAALVPALRVRSVRYLVIALAYVLDVSMLQVEGDYHAAPVIGLTTSGWVVKSTLQCTPLLFLAPLALWRTRGAERWSLVAIFVPCVALYASFLTRANMPNVHALGFPWVYMRYTLPALPALVVMAMVVVERLRPQRWDFAASAAGGLLLAYAYFSNPDALLAKRVMLLVVPILFGVATLVIASRAQSAPEPSRVARALLALTMALGIAAGLGHDLRANAEGKYWCDYWVDKLEQAVPKRFAMVGQLGRFDVLLTTTATHDVQYLSTHKYTSFGQVRPMVDVWRAEGRPIFLHWPETPLSPWPDVKFELAYPMPDVYRFEFVEPR